MIARDMAPTACTQKPARIEICADVNTRRVKTIPEAEGWAATWGAKIRALTKGGVKVEPVSGTEVGIKRKVETDDHILGAEGCRQTIGAKLSSMRSPKERPVLDLDGSMRRTLISEINEGRVDIRAMLTEIRESGRLPPYMDETAWQL